MQPLPTSAYKYFWDIDPADLAVSKYPRYVIERLLEYGDFPELRWLFRNFRRDTIIGILKTSGRLSKRRASAWANYFDIPKAEIKCLSKLSPKQHAVTWTY
jgi:hypothetical protein